jgi:hypothetical protein
MSFFHETSFSKALFYGTLFYQFCRELFRQLYFNSPNSCAFYLSWALLRALFCKLSYMYITFLSCGLILGPLSHELLFMSSVYGEHFIFNFNNSYFKTLS